MEVNQLIELNRPFLTITCILTIGPNQLVELCVQCIGHCVSYTFFVRQAVTVTATVLLPVFRTLFRNASVECFPSCFCYPFNIQFIFGCTHEKYRVSLSARRPMLADSSYVEQIEYECGRAIDSIQRSDASRMRDEGAQSVKGQLQPHPSERSGWWALALFTTRWPAT